MDHTSIILCQEDCYSDSEFNRDGSSQETSKCFVVKQLDYNERDTTGGYLGLYNMKGDYSNSKENPTDDVVSTQTKVESGIFEEMLKHADKFCGSRDCYDSRYTLLEDESYWFKEQIFCSGPSLLSLRKIESDLYMEDEKCKFEDVTNDVGLTFKTTTVLPKLAS